MYLQDVLQDLAQSATPLAGKGRGELLEELHRAYNEA